MDFNAVGFFLIAAGVSVVFVMGFIVLVGGAVHLVRDHWRSGERLDAVFIAIMVASVVTVILGLATIVVARS